MSINLGKVHFYEGVNYHSCSFLGKNTSFDNVTFKDESSFADIVFSGDIRFDRLWMAGRLRFSGVRIDQSSTFRFTHAVIPKQKEYQQSHITFQEIIFNPLLTTFYSIDDSQLPFTNGEVIPLLIINFEHCTLSDVNFTNCSLRTFRFSGTYIGDVNFINCRWPSITKKVLGVDVHKRVGILGEELYIDNESRSNPEALRHIADQYRQLKVSYDQQHDYAKAGEFYYNKNEIERRAEKIISSRKFVRKFFSHLINPPIEGFRKSAFKFFIRDIPEWITSTTKLTISSLYKYLAGYGEKPHWTALWLFFTIFCATGLNLLIGFIDKSSGKDVLIKYELGYGLPSWSDFTNSAIYTISHHVFLKSLLGSDNYSVVGGSFGAAIHLLIGLVLLLLITFLVIGLQRRFKRF